MELHQQCATLQQTKRLKELGVNQKSIFVHYENTGKILATFFGKEHENFEDQDVYVMACGMYSAFTVAELGVMLPESCDMLDSEPIYFSKCENAFGEGKVLWSPNLITIDLQKGFQTEAECKASVLIYLLEKKEITAEEVNARLKQ